MKIQVEITGILRAPTGERRLTLQFDEAPTISQVISAAGYNAREVRMINAVVDGKSVGKRHQLKHEDTVLLYVPVGGGNS